MGALGKQRGEAALKSEAPAFAQPLRRGRLNPKSETISNDQKLTKTKREKTLRKLELQTNSEPRHYKHGDAGYPVFLSLPVSLGNGLTIHVDTIFFVKGKTPSCDHFNGDGQDFPVACFFESVLVLFRNPE